MAGDTLENDQIIFATGGYDHTIKLWQTHTGICQRTMQHAESQVNALDISPDKKCLASASYQHIFIYDLLSNTPNAIVNYNGSSKNFVSVGFQEDGKWMYSGGEDGIARIWDLRAKNSPGPRSFEVLKKVPITCVCLHPNQTELFIGEQSGTIYRWDLRGDIYEQLIPENDAMILGIDIDPLGNYMASVNNKGNCYIWSLSRSTDTLTKITPKHKFLSHNRVALKCKFSPNSKLLVTTSADQSAKIWTVDDFELYRELMQENQRWVWDAAFSADSQLIFTASSDGAAKLWNIETGTVERDYLGHQKPITALAFRDDSC